MRNRKVMRLAAGTAAAACGAALLAFGGGSATAGPIGDTYYLSQSKKTFVSFVIETGSTQITSLGYTARKIPCAKGKPFSGMAVPGNRTAPIQENLLGEPFFEAFFVPGVPGWGGIAGKIHDTNVKGSLSLQVKRKVDQKMVWCRTGDRAWTAEPVSKDAWLAARKKQGYPQD